MDYKLVINELGFKEVTPKPSEEELRLHYNKNYFDSGTYSVSYSEEELQQKIIPFMEFEYIFPNKSGKMLDIGCGEGFSLAYFKKRGWDVHGIDFSQDGIKRLNIDILKHVKIGNIYEIIENKIKQDCEKYDLIICNNVLEHVTKPVEFIQKFKKLLAPKGICRLQVPNDDCDLHKLIAAKSLAPENFWMHAPDHLSYFNKDSLRKTLEFCNFEVLDISGDFPISLFLLNDDSNYNKKPSVGKNCHLTRVYIEDMLSHSMERLVAFRRGCGQSDLGRNTIVYCKKT